MNPGPLRPWVAGGALKWLPREDLELDQTTTAVSQCSRNAVSACIAPADDDYVFVIRGDEIGGVAVVQQSFCIRTQEVHREVNAGQVSILD
jgi:hypothetical protein